MPTIIADPRKRAMTSPRHPRQERTPPFATLFWGSLILVGGSLREGMMYLSIKGENNPRCVNNLLIIDY